MRIFDASLSANLGELLNKQQSYWVLIQYKDVILPTVEIRRIYDRLIPTVGFPLLVRYHLYIESVPW